MACVLLQPLIMKTVDSECSFFYLAGDLDHIMVLYTYNICTTMKNICTTTNYNHSTTIEYHEKGNFHIPSHKQ